MLTKITEIFLKCYVTWIYVKINHLADRDGATHGKKPICLDFLEEYFLSEDNFESISRLFFETEGSPKLKWCFRFSSIWNFYFHNSKKQRIFIIDFFLLAIVFETLLEK